MSIYKRGKKYGVDVVYPDGRRIKKLISTKKKEAQDVETQLKREILEQTWHIRLSSKLSFRKFVIKKYFPYIKSSLTASTFKSNTARIKKNILPFFLKLPLASITKEKIDQYKLKRIKDNASPNTIRNELNCLSHIFKMAIRWNLLAINPVKGVEKPKRIKRPPRYLSKEEEEKLLAHCDNHLYPIVITALNAGLRKGELLNLKWSDVNLENREITVQSHPEDNWHTKNYAYRVIGINDKLFDVLSNLPRTNSYVFTYAGQRILDIKKAITTAYTKAKVNHHGQPLHILRHTFGTRMAKITSPFQLQKLMGHADITTTMIYVNLVSSDYKDEVKKLD